MNEELQRRTWIWLADIESAANALTKAIKGLRAALDEFTVPPAPPGGESPGA